MLICSISKFFVDRTNERAQQLRELPINIAQLFRDRLGLAVLFKCCFFSRSFAFHTGVTQKGPRLSADRPPSTALHEDATTHRARRRAVASQPINVFVPWAIRSSAVDGRRVDVFGLQLEPREVELELDDFSLAHVVAKTREGKVFSQS